MFKKKFLKTLCAITTFVTCVCATFFSNTENAYAFGGVYDIMGYQKASSTQITDISFDGNGNCYIKGYSFFAETQHYIRKGYSPENGDTHSYRLKIANTNLVYDDLLPGYQSEDYTNIANDAAYATMNTNQKYFVDKSGARNGTMYNSQLRQVTFCFCIPAGDLAQLSSDGDYYLILEHNLYNLALSDSLSKIYTKTIEIHKLVNANFSSSKPTTTVNGKTISFTTSGLSAVTVSANHVTAKRADGSKFTDFNGGYFVHGKGQVSADTIAAEQQKVYQIDGSAFVNIKGASSAPLKVSYTVNHNVSSSSSVSNVMGLSLSELFAKYPELKDRYDENNKQIEYCTSELEKILKESRNCKKKGHINKSFGNCLDCLEKRHDNIEILKYTRECAQLSNKQILVQCHQTPLLGQLLGQGSPSSGTSSSYTTEEEKVLYCQCIYLEAPAGVDYYLTLNVIGDSGFIPYIIKEEKGKDDIFEDVAPMTACEGRKLTPSELEAWKSMIKQSADQNGNIVFTDVSADYLPADMCPKGYHLEIEECYALTDIPEYTAEWNLLGKKLYTKGGFPANGTVNCYFVYKNEAPEFSAKKYGD